MKVSVDHSMVNLIGFQAYDVYLFKTNGLPLFAGCTGSDYCMNHLPNHELHTAFMAALQSFSKESFEENTVQTVVMQDFQLNMKVYPEYDFIFGSVHPSSVETEGIRALLEKGGDVFVKKYGKEIVNDIIKESDFDEFNKELEKLELVPSTKTMSLAPAVANAPDIKVEKRRKGFLSKLFRR